MAGTISLRIDRRPDFFALLHARGEPIVLVATHNDRIIGCVSATMYVARVRGAAERIAHVGDLKVHPQFSGRRLSVHLISALEHRLRSMGIDVCFGLVAQGNARMTSLSEGRHDTPRGEFAGRFVVDQLVCTPFSRRSSRYRVERARDTDVQGIAALLESTNRAKLCAPIVGASDVAELVRESARDGASTVLVARDAEDIVATLTVSDTRSLRQNVLTGAPATLRLALRALRLAGLPLLGFRIPQIGDAVSTVNARHLACVDGHTSALRSLIAAARTLAFRRDAMFLSVGLHERDALRAAVAGTPRLTFYSVARLACLIRPERRLGLAQELPYEDFALV